MKSIWDIVSDSQETSKIDPERSRQILLRHNSIDSMRNYLEGVLVRLKQGEFTAVEETWRVAVPLAYRLAIDDTANGYRIASKLKDAAIWLEYPDVMSCVKEEIDWIIKTAFGVDNIELGNIQAHIYNNLLKFSKYLKGEWQVYGRQKCITSILSKFTKFKTGDKLPKDRNPEVLNQIKITLNQFETQIFERLKGNLGQKRPYDFATLKWLLPDLFAFTIQLTEQIDSSKNLGSAKASYKAVYKKLYNDFPASIYYGPAFSSSWHMNRMVCYLAYQLDLLSQVPFELFVRTDLDYFIGYGNYWRYKGVDLFATSSKENNTHRKQFVKKIRSFKNFSEVQSTIFNEITTGQLDLF